MKKSATKFYILLAIFGAQAFIFSTIVSAQTITDTRLSKNSFICGSDLNYFLRGGVNTSSLITLYAPATTFPAAAIDTCGKIDVYYEDIHQHFHKGFDDTTHIGSMTLGAIRRRTYSEVLNYIQSVIDFSNVSDTAHIRLYVDTSIAPISYPGYSMLSLPQFIARAYPQYDSSYTGIKYGWMNDYITRPSWHLHDSLPSTLFHARIQFNFDKAYILGYFGVEDSVVINWQSNADTPFTPSTSCGKSDLYSVMLHETTHCLGWFSLIGFRNSGGIGLTPFGGILTNPHIFTGIDWAVNVSNNIYPLGLTKVLSGSSILPVLDSANPLFQSNNNYWMDSNSAPYNYPVYSSGSSHSFISHLDDQPFNYTLRERISPGDQQDYVMGPFTLGGVLKRKYSKGEIHCLASVLGYTLKSGFVSSNTFLCTNHKPYSKKMAQMDINLTNYAYFTETIIPDDTLTNNVGVSRIVTSIPVMVAGGDLSDGDPSDNAHLYIDTTTLVNFRGCAIRGNNHGALSVSSDSKTIIYRPRPDFYGKAQFGFNVTDGKERGSFVVKTIEVLKGNNVSCPIATNMICNPGFEEGSEVRIYGTSETIPNSVATENMWHEGKWQGICFSDSHPYCFASNLNGYQCNSMSGTIVLNDHYGNPFGSDLYTTCGTFDTSTFEIGNYWLSSPTPHYWSLIYGETYDNPFPSDTSSQRYQQFALPGKSYYYLKDSARQCKKYKLEFDLYKEDIMRDSNFLLTIGFADHLVNLGTESADTSLNFVVNDSIMTTFDTWTHYSIPFHYCGINSSNILYLSSQVPGNPFGNFHIDNLSLKEDTTIDPPLLVTVTETTLPGCNSKLIAHVSNAFCSTTYLWNSTAGTVLTSSFDTVLSNIPYTYSVTVNDGCHNVTATYTMTETHPNPIIGSTAVCMGQTTTLSDITSGGIWTSSNPSIASIGSLTGIVTGIATGVVTITYTAGCISTKTITVNPLPSVIAGTLAICIGNSTVLSDATPGGVWSSNNISIATIGSSSGLATGVSAGTTTITYTIPTGCYITATITVNTTPFTITGPSNVCVGNTIFLTDLPGGGIWSSTNLSVANVGSLTGVVTGIAAGTTTISYILSTGCYSTNSITVNPLPSSIIGASPLCVGTTYTFVDITPGGIWSSTNPTIASIGSLTGFVNALSPGTTTIKYILSTGCLASISVSVYSAPAAITGAATLCEGANTTFTDATPGGTWSSSNPSVATIGASSGILSGISSGTATITYSIGTGCFSTITITVNPLPTSITGSSLICIGSSITLSSSLGGVWSSSNPSVATIGISSGIVTGVTAGISTITYTLATGCKALFPLTVNPAPSIITGPLSVCTGATITLYDSITGGSWVSSNPTIGSIGSASGVLTGILSGVTTITYTLPGGCFVTKGITINSSPAAITGSSSVCAGTTTILNDLTSGGTWSSSNPTIATIGTGSGIVTGVSAGVATITYTLATGCKTTYALTVNPNPVAIIGPTLVCSGTTITLSNLTTGGTWSSSSTSVATISSSGVLTGVMAGITTVSYILGTGCFVTATVTVNPTPSPISGTATICEGAVTALTDPSPGGTWSSSSPGNATISGAGLLTGVAMGTTIVTYSLPDGCYATIAVTVNPVPMPITGALSVCSGSTTLLADGTTGGTWSSATPAVATVGAGTGVVTGVSAGLATINYTLGTGCSRSAVVTVNLQPAVIAGPDHVCTGGIIYLSDATTGGTWSSSAPINATVGASTGIVTALDTGITVISYTMPITGCYSAISITVFDTTGSCSPCHVFPGTFTPLSGIISTSFGAGNYYVTGDITIAGALTFTGAVMLIAPGAHIYVNDTSSLTLLGCHLYCCSSMWGGIILQSGDSTTGVINIGSDGDAGTMIEDALTGVTAFKPVKPARGASYFILSTNAVFNRNNTGIRISNYMHVLPRTYEFHIENTVFTSRNFSGSTFSGYPFIWPWAAGLKSTVSMPSPYMAPYNVGIYPYAYCKNPTYSPATIGIELNNVGTGTAPDYAGVLVGSASTYDPVVLMSYNYELNLFDTLNYGILARNANLTVKNCAFAHGAVIPSMGGSPVAGYEGIGVYATEDDGNPYQLTVMPGYYNYGRGITKSPNYFYNCHTGIYAQNYYRITGLESYIISTQDNSSGNTNSGLYGYYILTPAYDSIKINSNTIINVANGIATKFVPGGMGSSYGWPGQTTINNNIIRAGVTPTGPAGHHYADKPIWVDNGIGYMGSILGIPATSQLNTDNNQIDSAYNGIYVNGISAQVATSNLNNINMMEYPIGNATTQYGIWHLNCSSDQTIWNTVTGTDYKNDNWKGIITSASSFHTVTCNSVSYLGRAFEFENTHLHSTWQNNTMTNDGKGFVLNQGQIWDQGGPGRPSGNQWLTDGGFAWTLTNFQTYTIGGILPSNSNLWILSSATTDPGNNYHGPVFDCARTYGCISGIVGTSGNGLNITIDSFLTEPPCGPQNNGGGSIHIAKREAIFGGYQYQHDWMAQYSLWQSLLLGDSVDTSAVIDTFIAMASHSRYAQFTEIENDLANGDTSAAQALLNAYGLDALANTGSDTATGVQLADAPIADLIVFNYRKYYQWYISYLENNLSATDSLQISILAQSCPFNNGAVVYKARALYDVVFDTLRIFENNCSDSVMADSSGWRQAMPAGVKPITEIGTQQYKLLPNPNIGDFILKQNVEDKNPVQIEIWDALGKCINKEFVIFENKTLHLSLNRIPGIYLLRIRDNYGISFKFRIIVE